MNPKVRDYDSGRHGDYCTLETAQRIAKARETLKLEPMETVRDWFKETRPPHTIRCFHSHEYLVTKWEYICPAPSTGESIAALDEHGPCVFKDDGKWRTSIFGSHLGAVHSELLNAPKANTPAEAVGLLLAEVYEAQAKGTS